MSETMRVAIIDYGSGNLRSVAKAFERAANEAGLLADIIVTSEPETVAGADRVVLPGVGAFADCKAGLEAVPGMHDALSRAVSSDGKPFLGICVGMQLMASKGLEKAVTDGLNWVPGSVARIQPEGANLKVPHIGWNTISVNYEHPLFADIPTGPHGQHAYFVHSYHLQADNPDHVLATTDYGGTVTAAVAKENMVGTQFHPEKSQHLGLALITNFLRWRP